MNGFVDWWIDRTVRKTIGKAFAERLPSMIDREIERQCRERELKLIQSTKDEQGEV